VPPGCTSSYVLTGQVVHCYGVAPGFNPEASSAKSIWYVLYPIHLVIFNKLMTAVSRRAELHSGVATEEAVA